MKVLHIFNTANIAVTIAKYQRMLDIQSDVVMRKTFTAFGGHEIIPNPYVIPGGAKRFLFACLRLIPKYDIIHSHAPRFTRNYLQKLIRWKPYVFHYHGSNIRGKWAEKRNEWKKADFLVVSTPELLNGAPKTAYYVPNPVDKNHFHRTEPYTSDTALFILRWKRQLPAFEQAKRECKEYNLDLTIIDRKKSHIPYANFPEYLQKFEYYIDTKTYEAFDPILSNTNWDIPYSEVKMNNSLSVTALQQLAIGGKVLNNGAVLTKFPSDHDPLTVAKKWIDIYEQLLE